MGDGGVEIRQEAKQSIQTARREDTTHDGLNVAQHQFAVVLAQDRVAAR